MDATREKTEEIKFLKLPFASLDDAVCVKYSYLYFYNGYTKLTNLGTVVPLPW